MTGTGTATDWRPPRDVIPRWKRAALFARIPLLFGLATWIVQVSGIVTSRDAALLGAGGHGGPAPIGVSFVVLLCASVLPGLAILRQGTERGVAIGLAGFLGYGLLAWIWFQQTLEVPPLLTVAAAGYVSQVLGIGWQTHLDQDVRHILPSRRRGVFISYRREHDEVTARLIKRELSARGFDVFLDVDDLGPTSRFDRRLLREIERRTGFVLLLSPGSLERCGHPDDWVRLEVAHALSTGRRVVPVTRAGFRHPAPSELPPEMGRLPLHNAVSYSSDYHDAAVGALVSFLLLEDRELAEEPPKV
ncbi:MAG TPA: toll/interleukin-1 receptor domain-containing protein [Gemmatimonadota bacterium]|nr:toll/interleukin-1 receptor domain-containing protein [Gemmatimonadota bacterium]